MSQHDQITLTNREMDVLVRLADGLSNKAIADQLCLVEGTVKTHIRNICIKLRAKNRTHAVVLALSNGLVEISNNEP